MASSPIWPGFFTPPAELLGWLDEQARLVQSDSVLRKHLLSLRWLVLAELDRMAPEGFKPGMPLQNP